MCGIFKIFGSSSNQIFERNKSDLEAQTESLSLSENRPLSIDERIDFLVHRTIAMISTVVQSSYKLCIGSCSYGKRKKYE